MSNATNNTMTKYDVTVEDDDQIAELLYDIKDALGAVARRGTDLPLMIQRLKAVGDQLMRMKTHIDEMIETRNKMGAD